MLNLQLLDEGAWASVSDGQTKAIKIMSIDTGAGPISFPSGAFVFCSVAPCARRDLTYVAVSCLVCAVFLLGERQSLARKEPTPMRDLYGSSGTLHRCRLED